MIRFRMYFDKDKETEWLNEMAREGWGMERFVLGCYTFRKCEPGEYVYQVDFGDRFFAVSREYRELMQEIGIEVIQPWGYWVILRKPASEGAFELYTDVESSIEHYTKIRDMFKAVTIIEIVCLVMMCLTLAFGGGSSPIALGACLFVGAVVLAFIRITTKTDEVIRELRERKGEILPEETKNNLSYLLLAGLLLNLIAVAMRERAAESVVTATQLLAIVLMMAGVFSTIRRTRK